MKPAWDTLMKEYKESATILVADVDCTGRGKKLCTDHGIKGFPTIKHGDPSNLEDYKGGRSLKDLRAFAAKLKPVCGPAQVDLCGDEEKKKISEFVAMGAEAREALIKEKSEEIASAEAAFEKFVEGLQAEHKRESERKEEAAQAIKDSGLSLLYSVRAFEKKKKEEM